jgi:hypothetical protein
MTIKVLLRREVRGRVILNNIDGLRWQGFKLIDGAKPLSQDNISFISYFG